ncbi:hypothetical protein [Paenibacillus eucommiae]|uniref:ABC-type glycerol-3-phosphate transport system substrate-binding protein n=1 Tax=Paenibacillus eucommiae TaxID=1355755 RepID=A0ABS4IS55_9BACL|nr:hypothetical protein [Paenibacillus eucommiae]MBP1990407.1 ABC-type glycerol-3-phosphate transport system substrate-binding protein [Paenibacillus eucommiae]
MARKRTIILFILIMAIVLAACSSKDNNNNKENIGGSNPDATKAPNDTGTPGAANAFDKHFDISYLSTFFNTNVVEGDWVTKQLEEKLNITIKPVKVDKSNKQQVELMYASGEMPDFGWQGPGANTPESLIEQEVTRTIPRSMIEKYAPSYAKLLDKYPQGWKKYESKVHPDEQLALSAYAEDLSISMMAFYRLDWLENLGIKPNGELKSLDQEGRIWYTDTGFTKDEHVNILRSFSQDDPNKNNKKDTYGMSAFSPYFNWTWAQLSGYAGFNANNLEEDGKTTDWYVSNKYKQFLKEAQALYKEGSVDPEFFTTDWNLWNEKIAGDRVGFWLTQSDYVGASYALDRVPQLLLNTQPHAKILITPSTGTTLTTLEPYTGNIALIRADVSDEKLIRILQWFEYMYFDPDAMIYTQYGQEGINYTWEGEPRKSAILPIKDSPAFTPMNGNYIATTETMSWTLNPLFTKVKAIGSSEAYSKLAILPHRNDFLNQTKYREVSSEVSASIDTIVNEFQFNAIGGKLDIDKEWDSYLKKLNDAGEQKLLEELNKMPLTADYIK